jgi:hypothetical protein
MRTDREKSGNSRSFGGPWRHRKAIRDDEKGRNSAISSAFRERERNVLWIYSKDSMRESWFRPRSECRGTR